MPTKYKHSDNHLSPDYQPIHDNLTRRVQFNEEELACFDSVIQFKAIARKEILLEAGQHCKHFNYVHSGALRAYTLDEQGKEATIMFGLADWWITDMFCFLNEKPAMMYIEAIENSKVFQITRMQLEELFIRIPKFEKFFRLLMQNAYTREQLRVIERLTLPAESRYNAFLAKYPHIAKVVTQKQIASYLGITPEFLSAIRKGRI